MSNSELFSSVARTYAEHRPTYPETLFDWLAAEAPARTRAWDCGCGSGQASLALAERFEEVVATDANAAQIAEARPHARVRYRVAPAEDSGLPPASADLIAVAQALHWFELERFYAEVRRVGRPGALLAAWTYTQPRLADAAAQARFHQFFTEIVGAWWPPERRHVNSGYRTLSFPFEELAPPPLALTTEWTLAQLAGYARSWSSTARYRAAQGSDPVIWLEEALAPCFGGPGARMRIDWPLRVRAARLSSL
jgi:SAM-dependent methyltransferase